MIKLMESTIWAEKLFVVPANSFVVVKFPRNFFKAANLFYQSSWFGQLICCFCYINFLFGK
jgi:hypothetical protein